jgi:hypothetical protein
MRTRVGFSTVAAGFVACAVIAMACNALDFGSRDLTQPPPPPPPDPMVGHIPVPAQPDAGAEPAVRTCPAVMTPLFFDYFGMCRHYCDTLDETLRYLALAQGQTPGDAGSVSQQCYDLRCVPMCVDQALCLTQCDADATPYAAVCANADAGADDPVCPSSPDDHLAACKAGCNPPPIVPPQGA